MLGLIENLSNEAYHASEGVSSSRVKVLLEKTPLHAVTPYSRAPSRAMEIGSAIHCAILEPERFASDYKVVDCDARTSALYKAACKHYPPALVLTDLEAENIRGMQSSALNKKSIREVLDWPSRRELSVYAKCPETGLLLKCRPDIEPYKGVGADLKKTQDCSNLALERSIFNYGYHISAAFYTYVWELATGEHLKEWRLLWVEENKPHASRVTRLPDDAIELGMKKVRMALRIWADCVASGDFFAYGDDVSEIGVPAWAYEQAEEISFDGLEDI